MYQTAYLALSDSFWVIIIR